MSTSIVIVGCGGFGREVHDVVEAINAADPFDDRWNLLGYVDDSPTDTNGALVAHRGSRVLGGVGWFDSASRDTRFVIGIGTGAVRRAIDARLTTAGFDAAVLVHPAASLGGDSRLAGGTVVCAGVRVTTNVTVGRHTHLNLNSTVGHDTTIGDYVTVNPIVAISGNVTLEDEVMLGTHSAVLQGLRIGARSIVGAGACVVKDVPADVTVKGVPAR